MPESKYLRFLSPMNRCCQSVIIREQGPGDCIRLESTTEGGSRYGRIVRHESV